MKKKIFGIGICLFIFILTGLIFFNSDSFKEKKEEYNKKQVTVKYEKIANNVEETNVILEYQKQFNNDDILGELSIPNTNLKVPVAQSSNNEYYLNHLLDKSYNTLGSIFLDYRNNMDNLDKNTINYYIDILRDEGYLRVNRTAGLNTIYPTDLAVNILDKYYSRL